jgi:hypothetical protein
MTQVWMPLVWMGGACAASWLALTATSGSLNPEVLYGMLAPLLSAGAAWVVMARTFIAAPERLTGVMVTGLAAKMVFFGVYVALMLKGLGLRPTPFVVSFAGYFIALHAMEAFFLRQLFADVRRSSSSE